MKNNSQLGKPMLSLIVNFPVVMDNGKIKTFTGYRVQHNNALGPTKGGLRYHPDVNLEELTELARLMTLKTALIGLPLGGAKGGVVCNPKEMSNTELERLTRAYVRAIAKNIGPDVDIPAPDVNTNAQTMAWFMDEYSQIIGKHCFGIVTGKPIELGGSKGRKEATSRGLVYTILEHYKDNIKGMTFIIQGYGNVGYHCAKLLHELGAKILAVSDSKGAIKAGGAPFLDPNNVKKHKDKTGSVIDYLGSKTPLRVEGSTWGINMTNKELLELECDILIPCALGDMIHQDNADKIQAKTIFEGANHPITPEADKILNKKGTFIVPDILANAGGVTVSYFEQVQNKLNHYWDEDEVNKKLEKIMRKTFRATFDLHKKCNISMREAAHKLALDRISKAMLFVACRTKV